MKYSHYRFKFYLNASHSIFINGKQGEKHPHTWEIIIEALKVDDDFVQFDYIEKEVEKYFEGWQDKDINSIEPFDSINPTLENLCLFLKNKLSDLLAKDGWLLTRIEIAETPSRSFIVDISDEIQMQTEKQIQSEFNESVDNKLKNIIG